MVDVGEVNCDGPDVRFGKCGKTTDNGRHRSGGGPVQNWGGSYSTMPNGAGSPKSLLGSQLPPARLSNPAGRRVLGPVPIRLPLPASLAAHSICADEGCGTW